METAHLFYLILEKRRKTILKINKEQAMFIRENAKDARIAMTGRNKNSRAKRWYVDESPEAFALLDKFEKSRPSTKY